MVTGEPPKVEMELLSRQFMTSARATTPPMDMPLPMPLAKVRMSGGPLSAWACQPQKWSPVRPQPVCTSSVIHRMPCRSRTSRNAAYRPSGGEVNPPTPWMGSAIRAATLRVWPSRSSRSATHASMNWASLRWAYGPAGADAAVHVQRLERREAGRGPGVVAGDARPR